MISSLRVRLNGSAYWRDILWQASGNGLAQAIGVLGMPLLTRLYTPQDFATQNLFLQTVGFVTGIMTWRYEYFIQLPKNESESKSLLDLVLFIGVSVFLVATPMSWIFRHTFAHWLGDTRLSTWLILVPLTALLICFSLALQHRVQRRKSYKASGLAELVSKITYISSGMLGSVALGGAFGLIAATGFGAVGKIYWLLRIGKIWKSITIFPLNINLLFISGGRFDRIKHVSRTYARLSSSMVISHIFVNFAVALPAVFIAHTYGTEILGNYALVVSTLYLPAGLVGSAIGQVYYQRAAEGWANGQGFSTLWQVTAKRLVFIGLPIYTLVALISTWGYPLIFGKTWATAGHYATIMSMSAFFSFISSPMDRSSLIVNVWWYLPIWHIVRVIATLVTIFAAWHSSWQFDTFLILLVIQMSLIYMIDYYAEWRFSLLKP